MSQTSKFDIIVRAVNTNVVLVIDSLPFPLESLNSKMTTFLYMSRIAESSMAIGNMLK